MQVYQILREPVICNRLTRQIHAVQYQQVASCEQDAKGAAALCLQVASYEENTDGVVVHFNDGHPSVKAKVLIGADGYFSRIRKQCLDDGPPTFAVRVSIANTKHRYIQINKDRK